MIRISGDITYITRTEEVVWAGVLLAVTLLIHGFGMVFTLYLTNSFTERLAKSRSSIASMFSILMGSWLIMMVHVIGVMVWAGFFQWKHCFTNFSTAIYFTGQQYTTVGSALHLPNHWRLLEPVVAGAGMLSFAWSAGVLMTLAMSFQNLHLQALSERGRKRGGVKPPVASDPLRSDEEA